MGLEEKKVAILEHSPYRRGVEKGYPEMQALAPELIAHGVDFHDMTLMFKDVEGPLYYDNACHFNKAGNVIFGKNIAKVILDSMK